MQNIWAHIKNIYNTYSLLLIIFIAVALSLWLLFLYDIYFTSPWQKEFTEGLWMSTQPGTTATGGDIFVETNSIANENRSIIPVFHRNICSLYRIDSNAPIFWSRNRISKSISIEKFPLKLYLVIWQLFFLVRLFRIAESEAFNSSMWKLNFVVQ